MEENTVEDIRDDLDNYGGHVPVYIESRDGNLFQVGEIRAIDNGPDGMTCVVIEVGPRTERGHY